MELYLAMLAVLLVGGILMVRDGMRLLRHLALAERLVRVGMKAEDAYRLAGCYFWNQPWYRRLGKKYPPDKLPDEFRLIGS